MCGWQVKLADHIFVECVVSSTIWYRVFSWACQPWPLSRLILKVFKLFLGLWEGNLAFIGFVSI